MPFDISLEQRKTRDLLGSLFINRIDRQHQHSKPSIQPFSSQRATRRYSHCNKRTSLVNAFATDYSSYDDRINLSSTLSGVCSENMREPYSTFETILLQWMYLSPSDQTIHGSNKSVSFFLYLVDSQVIQWAM